VGDARVGVVVRGQHHRLRAHPTCPHHRHGAVHPVHSRLVGRGQHHPPRAAAAHDDRLPAQLGVREQRDAGVEGVHVDVQDRAAGVIPRRTAGWAERRHRSPAHVGPPPARRHITVGSATHGEQVQLGRDVTEGQPVRQGPARAPAGQLTRRARRRDSASGPGR
jgi:hypothetical protein